MDPIDYQGSNMNFTQAIEIIYTVQDNFGEGLLETLEYMRDNLNDFSDQEVLAFRVVFSEMSKLFAPA